MTPDDETPAQLDALTPHQLIAEIQQIVVQYEAAVPGTRRSWPESVRARILALGRLGIPKARISELTGIPPATVFLWCKGQLRASRKARGHFVELPAPPQLNRIVPTVGILTVGIPPAAAAAAAVPGSGLRLCAPDGFSFEGLSSVDECARLYRELRLLLQVRA